MAKRHSRRRVTDASILRTLINAEIQPYPNPSLTRQAITRDVGPCYIIDLGPTKTGRRILPSAARRKGKAVVDDFGSFMMGRSKACTRFWNFRPQEGKIRIQDLRDGLRAFNKNIGNAYEHLQKSYAFDPFLTVIQVKMDPCHESFDIHAHIICDISGKDGHGRNEDKIKAYLDKRFALFAGTKSKLKSARFAAQYIMNNLYHHSSMAKWPGPAIEHAWALSGSRTRLVRPGGSFAIWRKGNKYEQNKNPQKGRNKPRQTGSNLASGYSTVLSIAGVLRPVLVTFKPISGRVAPPQWPQAPCLVRGSVCEQARALSPAFLVVTSPNNPAPRLNDGLPQITIPWRKCWWRRAWPYDFAGRNPAPIRERLKRMGLPESLRGPFDKKW